VVRLRFSSKRVATASFANFECGKFRNLDRGGNAIATQNKKIGLRYVGYANRIMESARGFL
jgi:hypothetical protein